MSGRVPEGHEQVAIVEVDLREATPRRAMNQDLVVEIVVDLLRVRVRVRVRDRVRTRLRVRVRFTVTTDAATITDLIGDINAVGKHQLVESEAIQTPR